MLFGSDFQLVSFPYLFFFFSDLFFRPNYQLILQFLDLTPDPFYIVIHDPDPDTKVEGGDFLRNIHLADNGNQHVDQMQLQKAFGL